EQLKSIAAFEVNIAKEIAMVSSELGPLRGRLFNAAYDGRSDAGKMPAVRPQDAGAPGAGAPITLLECSDRETEIRSIAREIKSLILERGYRLSDIALVVRERAAYADTIQRVCAEESIPCNLERRVQAPEVPAVRACAKLFQLLKAPSRDRVTNPKASELARLVKTGYFRVSPNDLQTLTEAFDNKYQALLENPQTDVPQSASVTGSSWWYKLRAELGIGRWSPDKLENAIAYVGSELRVKAWIERAQRLVEALPS